MAVESTTRHMDAMATLASSLPRPALPDPVRAVIFDMDGTLIDTEAVHLRAFSDIGKAMGWPLSEELLLSMVGIHREANMAMFRRTFGPDFPLERFYAESDALFEAMLDAQVPPRPGAAILLEHLAKAGIPMAVATSTMAPYAQQRLERAGFLPYFKTVVTRTDVEHPKPDLQPYLIAAQRLGFDPADCVAVEDSYAGVRSATAAGIATVMVPDMLPPTEDLILACATILPSLADLRDLLLATE